MARRFPESYLPESKEIEQEIHFIQLPQPTNSVTIHAIPSIHCKTGLDVCSDHNGRNVIPKNPNINCELTEESTRSDIIPMCTTRNEKRWSANYEQDVQTVNELFRHISETDHTSVQPETGVRDSCPTKTPYGKIEYTGGSVEPHAPLTNKFALSTETQHTVTSADWQSERNFVNFNRQESLKDPNPKKEIDIFLPEAETIDLSLTTRSWKGRAPPTHLFDVEANDKRQFTDDEIKISNQPYTSRTRSGSFEKIPGTGQYIRNIQVKRYISSAPAPTERKHGERRITVATDTANTTNEDGDNLNTRSQTHSSVFGLERVNKTSTVDTHKDQCGSDGINYSMDGKEHYFPSSLETGKDPAVDEILIVDIKKADLKRGHREANDGQRLHKNLKMSSGQPTSTNSIPGITINENCKDNTTYATKCNIPRNQQSDSVDAKEEFNIYGIVAHANDQNRYDSNQFQIAVDSNNQRWKPIIPLQHNQQSHQFRASEHAPLQRLNGADNINVYVNVSLNVKPDRKPHGSRTVITPQQHLKYVNCSSTDFRGPMKTQQDFSDSTDKSLTSSTISDDEFSSGELSSSSMSDSSTQKAKCDSNDRKMPVHNNLSVNSLDRFRIHNILGPGGLSPIPSESYESDSTPIQVDSTSCEDGSKTPTGSQHSLASSDTTIKELLYDEPDNPRPPKRLSSKWHSSYHKHDSTNQRTRKISYEEDISHLSNHNDHNGCDSVDRRRSPHAARKEHDYPYRPSVSRSVSQPEQFLLDKRTAFINKMKLNMEHAGQAWDKFTTHSDSHKRLQKAISDPNRHSEQHQEDVHDARLPLNVQLTADVLSSEDNDGSAVGTNRRCSLDHDPNYFSDTITRQEFSRSRFYSSRVSKTSSVYSAGSRPGRRIRQLSVDIGEEWENVNIPQRAKTVSDVGSVSSGTFSYRSLRNKRFATEMPVGIDAVGYGSIMRRDNVSIMQLQNREFMVETGDIIPTDLQAMEEIDSPVTQLQDDNECGAGQIIDVPGSVAIEVVSPDDDGFSISSPKKRILMNNPYNSINQKFHSALHCPCFLFFCFLCCAPAVYWMQRSDYEFDYSSEKLAKTFGRRATVLYIIGAFTSVILLGTMILLTYMLLQNEEMFDSTD